MLPLLLICFLNSDLIKRSEPLMQLFCMNLLPYCRLQIKFFLCRYLTETVGVIMPPRIREMGIKCLTVTVLQQHRAQSALEHLEGEDWMYELAKLEASLSSLNHFFSTFVTYIVIAVVLTLEFCHLSHSGY